MGIFEKIFGKRDSPKAANGVIFRMLDGYTPSFHTWNGSLYESDLIRAALDAHGRHAAKLQPTIHGTGKPALTARLRLAPNEFQTWPQFLYRLAVTLYAKNTAFIVPVFGSNGDTEGIIGIIPSSWELVESRGVVYIRFRFPNQQTQAVELSRVGILTRYQMDSELFGADNQALKPTLDLIEMQRQGIEEGIRNSATYRFMATSSNWSKDEDLARERKRFDANNFRGGGSGGVLLWPNTFKDVKQISQDAYKVDADQMKLIRDNVYSYFGVNEDIIQNKAFGDSWLAFYEGSIEWLAVQLSEVISRMLFSERERQFGNAVFFTSNRLQYMSNADKLAAISQLADRGLMTRNELREILNLSPLPAPYGDQIPARGEYYNVNEEGTSDATET